MPDPTTEGELGRLRNRITALEANGSELLARAERAEAVIAALPDPSTAEELREKITELLDNPDEALLDAFLGYAWSETARIAGGEMTARWQAEDLLRIAHETSNRSEAERARAVQRAERAEAELADEAQRNREIESTCNRLLTSAVELVAERDALKATVERVRALDDPYPCGSVYAVPYGTADWRSVLPVVDLRAALRAPESNAPAPSPVSAATEAHGETAEAQEGSR